MSAIFAQRYIGPLAFLDRTYRHVHTMVKSRHTKDWCAQSWSMVVQFGIHHPNILHQGELEKVQKRAPRFVIGNYTYIYETGSMTGILELRWESLKIGGKIADS